MAWDKISSNKIVHLKGTVPATNLEKKWRCSVLGLKTTKMLNDAKYIDIEGIMQTDLNKRVLFLNILLYMQIEYVIRNK